MRFELLFAQEPTRLIESASLITKTFHANSEDFEFVNVDQENEIIDREVDELMEEDMVMEYENENIDKEVDELIEEDMTIECENENIDPNAVSFLVRMSYNLTILKINAFSKMFYKFVVNM